ncbi:MAG: DUF1592 domain-containing protein [Myxococcota bacterium]
MNHTITLERCLVMLIALLVWSGCGEDTATQPNEPAETTPNDTGGNNNNGNNGPTTETHGQDLRRLTRLELITSLHHVLGKITVEDTEPDLRRAGFARVGARDVITSPSGVEQYALAIEQGLDQVFADDTWRASFIGCAQESYGTQACVTDFTQRVGQRAWRRPLSNNEVARYSDLHTRCMELLNDFDQSMRCVASGLLQSPYFIYRVEIPKDTFYTDYAMASRLAYFLWSAPPDTALLQAAHAGELDTAEGVRAQAQRMLDDPKAREGLATFVDEWFRLDRLDRLERDLLALSAEEVQFQLGREGKLQPWLKWMAFAAREELRRTIVSHVLDDDRDYMDLLITDKTWVDPHLKAFYELPPDGVVGSGETSGEEQVLLQGPADAQGFAPAVHSPDSPRRGILGSMAMLGQLGKQNETSPTRRGLYVMEKILCLELGDPPDNIDICERPEGVSRRASIEEHHLCAQSCQGCHVQMDPIGFAMDRFDTIGRYREEDDWGYELDTQVDWTLVHEGQSTQLQFNSLSTMADTFYSRPEATACVTRQMFRYGTGREESRDDRATLDALNEAFVQNGRSLKTFLLHFVGTDAFRKAAAPETEAPVPTDPEAQLEAIAQDLFAERCTPCHVGSTLGGLDLNAGADLKSRLLTTSTELPTMPLVTPGQPDRSYLWHKLNNTHLDVGGSGELMPPNGALKDDELNRIQAWIQEVKP